MKKRRKRLDVELEKKDVPEFTIDVPNDIINEQIILAAEIVDPDVRKKGTKMFPPDAFYADEHKAIQHGLIELERKGLAYDPAVVVRLVPDVDVRLLERYADARPDVPKNLGFHFQNLKWDWHRAKVTQGPLAALLEAVQNPKEQPEKVKALARQVGDAFQATVSSARYLRNSKDVIREAMIALRKRVAGEAFYPFGVEGLDFDEAGKRRLPVGAAPGLITTVTGMSGGGKALALDTPIPTTNGWTTMRDIEIGDQVFDENGEPCTVVYCSPIMKNRDCYEVVFSDGATIVADAEHLWLTRSYRERHFEYCRSVQHREVVRRRRGSKIRRTKVSRKLTAHWADKRLQVPRASVRTTEQIARTLVTEGGHKNHAIDVVKPLVLLEADLEIDPYLLGLWLGDGSSDSAVFHTNDVELVRYFEKKNYIVRKGKAKYRYNISNGFLTDMKETGVHCNKHIPQHYLRASIPQRISLLQGLMDTDGHVNKKGQLEFCSMNETLTKGFEELLITLGIRSKARVSDAKLNGRVVGKRWRFKFMTNFLPFKLRRKAERWKAASRKVCGRRYIVDVRRVKSVPVRCIQVDSPSHLYLAGRDMIPTHNTTLAAHLILGLARQKRKVLVGAWEVRAPMTLELLATISLGFSRTKVLAGDLTEGDLRRLYKTMKAIGKWVKFVENPFQRGSVRRMGKVTNDDYLDILQEHVEASGCDVCVWDLFDRCLRWRKPDDEQEALYRLLEMADVTRTHHIVVHQQLIKGQEVRSDKKPSIAGLKGSSAYVDVSGQILAPHMPALFKNVPNDTFEVYGLKSRFSFPFGVEFDWIPDSAQLSGGHDISYDDNDELEDEVFGNPDKNPKKKRRFRN